MEQYYPDLAAWLLSCDDSEHKEMGFYTQNVRHLVPFLFFYEVSGQIQPKTSRTQLHWLLLVDWILSGKSKDKPQHTLLGIDSSGLSNFHLQNPPKTKEELTDFIRKEKQDHEQEVEDCLLLLANESV